MCRNGKWRSSTERMVCGHHVYGDVWEVALHGYILKSGSLLVHPWCYKEGYSVYPMIEFSAVADEIVGDGKFLESTHCMGASHLRLSCHNKWRELYVPTMGPKCTRCPPWTHTHTHTYIYIYIYTYAKFTWDKFSKLKTQSSAKRRMLIVLLERLL